MSRNYCINSLRRRFLLPLGWLRAGGLLQSIQEEEWVCTMAPQQNGPAPARDPAAAAAALEKLAARFGNRLVTSMAVREQHANTTTWVANEPPDAVVFAQSTA